MTAPPFPPPPPGTSTSDDPPARARGPLARRFYKLLGLLMLGLAVAGVVLPGLPATPFALLAAWAFRRGSPEWAARLERHPRLGPALRAWRERRAVPRRAKALAALSMAASFALLWASGTPSAVLLGVGAILAATLGYLLSRPAA